MRRLNNFEDYVCRALLVLFVTLLFVQVVLRELFDAAYAELEELSRFAFVWFAFLGAAQAAKLNAHNRVELHLKALPPRIYAFVILCVDLIWVAFNLAIVWKSWEVISGLLEFPYTSPGLRWSMAYVYMIFPIAFLLISVRTLSINYARIVLGREPTDADSAEIEEIARSAAEEPK